MHTWVIGDVGGHGTSSDVCFDSGGDGYGDIVETGHESNRC